MDIVDQAQQTEDLLRELRIAAAHQAPRSDAAARGICLNCGVPLGGVARWCDADCRDDWLARRRP